MADPQVLDPCCGSRMMWFDKNDPRAIFGDRRSETLTVTDRSHKEDGTRTLRIEPDTILDFRALPFSDGRFKLVAFDPPHLVRAGPRSWLAAKYGKLGDNWREDLRQGFAECWRVLDGHGVLVFKWNETQVKLAEVLALAPAQPLFGQISGRAGMTHWLVFMKPANDNTPPAPATKDAGAGDERPAGWITTVQIAGGPEDPPEYDTVFHLGDVPPDDRNNWTPLYPRRSAPSAPAAPVSGAVLTDEQILSCLDGRQPVRAHHGAAVFEYRLFALVDFARRVLAIAATQQAEPTSEAPLKGTARYARLMAERNDPHSQFWLRSKEAADRVEKAEATQQAEPSAGSGPWHRLVKVPLNLTEPPVYKDRWVPCMSDAPGAEPMPAFVQELRKLPDLSEEDVQVLIAMVHAGHDYAANLASKEATPSAASPELIAAARAVVARWHSPKWKDEAPTAEFIQRLERALARVDSQTPASTGVVSQKPVEVDDNPWIPHNGGPCPVAPDAVVDVMLREGFIGLELPAEAWVWSHSNEPSDIIEYRLHREGGA